jgi:hypothetical protein
MSIAAITRAMTMTRRFDEFGGAYAVEHAHEPCRRLGDRQRLQKRVGTPKSKSWSSAFPLLYLLAVALLLQLTTARCSIPGGSPSNVFGRLVYIPLKVTKARENGRRFSKGPR